MTKQQRNIGERCAIFKRKFMAITIERNQKIQGLQIIDNTHVCVCVRECECDYTNSDVKTSKISNIYIYIYY